MTLWNTKTPINFIKKQQRQPQQQFCTCMDHSGLTIFVRARPWQETAFVQIRLPVAISYETFVCKLCVALDLDRALVKKVLKIPDVLVRTTEDVIRLRSDDRLELILHSSFWKYKIQKRIQSARPFLITGFFTLLLATISTVALNQKEILIHLNQIRNELKEFSDYYPISRNNIKDLEISNEESENGYEVNLFHRLNDLEKKLEDFVKTMNEKTSGSNLNFRTIHDLMEQMKQVKNIVRKKIKMKEGWYGG